MCGSVGLEATCPEPAMPPSPGRRRGWLGGSSLSRNLFDQREHVRDGVERQRGPGVSPGAAWGTPRITLPEVSPARYASRHPPATCTATKACGSSITNSDTRSCTWGLPAGSRAAACPACAHTC